MAAFGTYLHSLRLSFAENTAKPLRHSCRSQGIISTRGDLTLNDRNHRFNKVVDDRTCLFSSCPRGAYEPFHRRISVFAAVYPLARRPVVSRNGQESLQSRGSSAACRDSNWDAGDRL